MDQVGCRLPVHTACVSMEMLSVKPCCVQHAPGGATGKSLVQISAVLLAYQVSTQEYNILCLNIIIYFDNLCLILMYFQGIF